MLYLDSVLNKFIFFVSEGNEYSWDGNGPAFESDRTCLFFKREVFRFTKKLSAHYLSASVLSA